MNARACQLVMGGSLLQLEVDVDGVGVAGPQAGGECIDAGDAVEGCEDGLIHEGVATGADDFRACDGAVAFDLDFHRADEGFVLFEDGCGLLPLAEESVVDEFVIPGEFTGGATRSASAGAAACCAASPAGCTGFSRAWAGRFSIAGRCRGFCFTGCRSWGRRGRDFGRSARRGLGRGAG
jgi:hypothetical protein